MSTPHKQNFLTPTGRLVGGSLYDPQTTDADGKPLVVKNGPNAGQPTVRYYFALAIPKMGEQHWATTSWGAILWAVGHASFPGGQAARPDFAWKVTDGDSQIPNTKGVKPASREGHPGHWVLSLSSGYAPKVYNSNGTSPIPEKDAVKLGWFVQVSGTVDGNESTQKPGIYLNHSLVALQGYGQEIIMGPDPTAVGFGGGPAPAGMSTTPAAGMSTPPAPGAPPPAPGAAPPPPGAYAPPPAPGAAPPPPAAYAPPPPPAPPGTAVQPHQAFLAPPGAPPAPPAAYAPPPPPPPPAGPRMTAKAAGQTREQWHAAGWTDELLRAHGYMEG